MHLLELLYVSCCGAELTPVYGKDQVLWLYWITPESLQSVWTSMVMEVVFIFKISWVKCDPYGITCMFGNANLSRAVISKIDAIPNPLLFLPFFFSFFHTFHLSHQFSHSFSPPWVSLFIQRASWVNWQFKHFKMMENSRT